MEAFWIGRWLGPPENPIFVLVTTVCPSSPSPHKDTPIEKHPDYAGWPLPKSTTRDAEVRHPDDRSLGGTLAAFSPLWWYGWRLVEARARIGFGSAAVLGGNIWPWTSFCSEIYSDSPLSKPQLPGVALLRFGVGTVVSGTRNKISESKSDVVTKDFGEINLPFSYNILIVVVGMCGQGSWFALITHLLIHKTHFEFFTAGFWRLWSAGEVVSSFYSDLPL